MGYFDHYEGWEYEPSSIVLDGREFTAMLKVVLPDRESWLKDVREWERLIALQVAALNAWGPQSCKWVRKSLGLSRVKLAEELCVPVQLVEEIEAGAMLPPSNYTKSLTGRLQLVLDSL